MTRFANSPISPDAAGPVPGEVEHVASIVDEALNGLGPGRTPIQRAPTVRMAGVAVSAVTEAEVVASVVEAIDRGEGGWVFTPNVDHLRRITRDASMLQLARGADVSVADGMPLIWSSRLAGEPLPERVAGSSLIWTLSGAAAATGKSIFLLGGSDGVADRAGAMLRAAFPALAVAGTYCPPVGYERDAAEVRAIVDAVVAARPDIVFVGLGFPKQERLIEILREESPAAWFLAIGAALSFVAGETSRAPRWMQRSGLEWAFRLVSEPRRLFRRYVVDGIPFVVPMLVRSAVIGARRRLGPG